jgi:hypothetical protein
MRKIVKSKNIERMREDPAASRRPSAEDLHPGHYAVLFARLASKKGKSPPTPIPCMGLLPVVLKCERILLWVAQRAGGCGPAVHRSGVVVSVWRAALFLAVQERVDGCVELVAALEEVELEDEYVAHERAAELLDKRACCCCGATCVVR